MGSCEVALSQFIALLSGSFALGGLLGLGLRRVLPQLRASWASWASALLPVRA